MPGTRKQRVSDAAALAETQTMQQLDVRCDLALPRRATEEPYVDADICVDLTWAEDDAAAVAEVGCSNAGLLFELAQRGGGDRLVRELDLAAEAVPSGRSSGEGSVQWTEGDC